MIDSIYICIESKFSYILNLLPIGVNDNNAN